MLKHIKKWDRNYLELAMVASTWSKEEEVGLGEGAVICNKYNHIVAANYNGLPRDVELEESEGIGIIDAVTNAVASSKKELVDCTLYTFPIPPSAESFALAWQESCRRYVSLILPDEEFVEPGLKRAEHIKKICAKRGAEFLLYWPADLIEFPRTEYDVQTLWHQRWMNHIDKTPYEHKPQV